MDEALKIKNTDIAKELSLPPVKLHCSSKFISDYLTVIVNYTLFWLIL